MSLNKSALFTWAAAVLLFFVFAATSLALDKPVGAVEGRVAIETVNHLAAYGTRSHKVYALVSGPRSGPSIERGVWVKKDGTFQISNLPVGEYSLSVNAPGYETFNEYSLFVDEAKVTHPKTTITLNMMTPSINIASNSRVFTTKEQPHFWVNAYGADHVKIKLFRKDVRGLIVETSKKMDDPDRLGFDSSLNFYKPYEKAVNKNFSAEKPLQVMDRVLHMDHENWSREQFKLDKPLERGEYLALAEISNVQNKKDYGLFWFSVSDIGLILKQAPHQTWVRAIDLITQKPQAGVHVNLANRGTPGETIASGVTQADGTVTLDLPKEMTNLYDLMAFGEKGQDKAFGGVYSYPGNSDRYRTYFYTERPVYRLGQSVYFKGIVRKLDLTGMKNIGANFDTEVNIADPDGNDILHEHLITNAFGTFHGVVNIPEDAKTGGYNVTIHYPDGTYTTETFEVAQYRKPEYQVEVTPLKERVSAGESFKARVRATYFFGAPVTNARIKYSVYASDDWSTRYRLMPRPSYYAYFDDWEGSPGYEDAGYAGDFISEGYAQTDENGEAIVEVKTQPIVQPKDGPYNSTSLEKRYKVDTEVTDISRMTVIGNGATSVTAGDFSLFIEPQRDIYKTGETITSTITAVDYSGKPVANQNIQVNLSRWVYHSNNSHYEHITAGDPVAVKTDAEGKATVSFSPKGMLPADSYYIDAQTKDAGGHSIFKDYSVWVASDQSPFLTDQSTAEKQPFTVKMDKPVYQPGDTARAVISGPFTGKEGAEAVVAIESTKIHELRIVPLDSAAKMVEIPLKDDYVPNVFVSVTYVDKKHQFFNTSSMIKVSPENNFLNVVVTTDKEKYKPGETVNYTVQATHPDGTPSPNTELSLGVVDESIYSIRPEAVEDIRKFFYGERDNWIVTLCTFPEEYSGGPDKDGPRVRKDFRDMAAWHPNLVTDAQGIAHAEVKLPDNLTTWRATVRGIDSETKVGWGINKILSTQDFIVRLALPRFFTVGDEGFLTAIVHNYTDQAQKVQLTLAVPGQLQTTQPLLQQLEVQPDKAARYEWPVKVMTPGKALFNIKAEGQNAGDALEMERMVNPLGVQAFISQAGVLLGEHETQEIPIKLPEGAELARANFHLAYSPSSIGPVLGNFSTLIDYPYGCTEQTMSRLFPSVIAMRLHQALNVPLTEASQKRFNEVYDKAIDKLYDYQQGDGGWGWWQNDTPNAYLTAYVLEGLKLVKDAGYEVDAERTKNGLKWMRDNSQTLYKELTNPNLKKEEQYDIYGIAQAWTDLAYMQYALSLYGEKTPANIKSGLHRQSGSLSSQALSYLALAFHNQKDPELAKQFYAGLTHKANHHGAVTDWSMKQIDYRFTDAEVTALALRAVLVMDPDNASLIESAKEWLLTQRDQSGWQNTKTTAQALRVLMEEEIQNKKTHPSDFKLLVKAADKELLNESFSSANLYGPESVLNLGVSTLAEAQQKLVELLKEGPGRLYYQSLVTYWQVLKPGQKFEQKPMPDGLTLRREFYRLVPSAMTSDGTIRFKTEPIKDHTVHTGETILMKVFVETPISLPYLMMEAPLPSGGEVSDSDPREALADSESESASADFILGDWGDAWWTHRDLLDDKVVFFTTNLAPKKKHEFHAMIRMEMPGTFQMNPVRLEGMYNNRIRAVSGLDTLKVIE